VADDASLSIEPSSSELASAALRAGRTTRRTKVRRRQRRVVAVAAAAGSPGPSLGVRSPSLGLPSPSPGIPSPSPAPSQSDGLSSRVAGTDTGAQPLRRPKRICVSEESEVGGGGVGGSGSVAAADGGGGGGGGASSTHCPRPSLRLPQQQQQQQQQQPRVLVPATPASTQPPMVDDQQHQPGHQHQRGPGAPIHSTPAGAVAAGTRASLLAEFDDLADLVMDDPGAFELPAAVAAIGAELPGALRTAAASAAAREEEQTAAHNHRVLLTLAGNSQPSQLAAQVQRAPSSQRGCGRI
jgi:hypothetical protein